MILNVYIAEDEVISRRRLVAHAELIDRGEMIEPLCEIGFNNMTQFGAVFTPKRWELIEALKAAGPLSIYALAKQLNRHYRNVHKDVTALTEWLVIEKDDDSKVFVPWDEIDVRWPLLKQVA